MKLLNWNFQVKHHLVYTDKKKCKWSFVKIRTEAKDLKTLKIDGKVQTFVSEIEDISGINLRKCYQCGKCSAGCPMVFNMDYPPSHLIRLAQVGQRTKVLCSSAIWTCVSCITCSTRCPKEVEIADLMDVCRELSLKEGKATVEQANIQRFHKSFLETIRTNGRLYEVMLIAKYKMRALALFQDVEKSPRMLLNGKLKLLPHKVKNIEAVRKIFDSCTTK